MNPENPDFWCRKGRRLAHAEKMTIIELAKAGEEPRDIREVVKVSSNKVIKNWIDRWNQEGSIFCKTPPGRPEKLNPEQAQGLIDRVREDGFQHVNDLIGE